MERSVELARQHWAEGHRRLVRTREQEPELYERLVEQVGIVTTELRARVGQTFTLAQLAEAYDRSDGWTHAVVEERAETPALAATASTAADAAFHVYARGAQDYQP